jgi:hypothetical protein
MDALVDVFDAQRGRYPAGHARHACSSRGLGLRRSLGQVLQEVKTWYELAEAESRCVAHGVS